MGNAERLANPGTGTDADLGWLLDDLVTRVNHVDKALDPLPRRPRHRGVEGLQPRRRRAPVGRGGGLPEPRAGAGQHFGGGRIRQTIVEMDNIFLFVTSAGEGSCLAVLSPATADVGLIAYEMAILVKRVGPHLSVLPRPATAGDGAG